MEAGLKAGPCWPWHHIYDVPHSCFLGEINIRAGVHCWTGMLPQASYLQEPLSPHLLTCHSPQGQDQNPCGPTLPPRHRPLSLVLLQCLLRHVKKSGPESDRELLGCSATRVQGKILQGNIKLYIYRVCVKTIHEKLVHGGRSIHLSRKYVTE